VGYLLTGPVGAAVGEQRLLVVGGLVGTGAMALALLPRSTRQLARLADQDGPFAPMRLPV